MTVIDSIYMVVIIVVLMICISELYFQYRFKKISSNIINIVEDELYKTVELSYLNLLNVLLEENIIDIDDTGTITGLNGNKSDWLKLQNNLEIYNV